MRSISLLLIGAALAGCSTTAQPPADADRRKPGAVAALLAGKVAGPPVSCLPSYRANDMTVIDEDTVTFRREQQPRLRRSHGRRLNMLGRAGYALVTRSFGIIGPVPRRNRARGRHAKRLHRRQLRRSGTSSPTACPRDG